MIIKKDKNLNDRHIQLTAEILHWINNMFNLKYMLWWHALPSVLDTYNKHLFVEIKIQTVTCLILASFPQSDTSSSLYHLSKVIL